MDDMRGLEALENIKKRFYWEYELCENLNQMEDETSIIEKSLEALEIIKDKPYEVDWIVHLLGENTDYQMYVDLVTESKNKLLERFLLTESEYNLLKEVLYE